MECFGDYALLKPLNETKSNENFYDQILTKLFRWKKMGNKLFHFVTIIKPCIVQFYVETYNINTNVKEAAPNKELLTLQHICYN